MVVNTCWTRVTPSTSERSDRRLTVVPFALPVVGVFAVSLVWPALGEFVTLLLKIAVLYVFSTG
jgi:hypothetical protein